MFRETELSSISLYVNVVVEKRIVVKKKKIIEYQAEPKGLVEGFMGRGHITPWELLKIVSWKSAKGVAWLSLSTEEEIISYTGETVAGLKSGLVLC